jgi:hypothetical protein
MKYEKMKSKFFPVQNGRLCTVMTGLDENDWLEK